MVYRIVRRESGKTFVAPTVQDRPAGAVGDSSRRAMVAIESVVDPPRRSATGPSRPRIVAIVSNRRGRRLAPASTVTWNLAFVRRRRRSRRIPSSLHRRTHLKWLDLAFHYLSLLLSYTLSYQPHVAESDSKYSRQALVYFHRRRIVTIALIPGDVGTVRVGPALAMINAHSVVKPVLPAPRERAAVPVAGHDRLTEEKGRLCTPTSASYRTYADSERRRRTTCGWRQPTERLSPRGRTARRTDRGVRSSAWNTGLSIAAPPCAAGPTSRSGRFEWRGPPSHERRKPLFLLPRGG